MINFQWKSGKFYFKYAHYVVSILLGFVFLILAKYFPNCKELFMGISSTSFSIVAIFLIVSAVEYFTNRELNKEIHQYINYKSSKILMEILQRLCRMVSLNNMKPTALNDFKTLGEHTGGTLSNVLLNKEFLGFDIFIDWHAYLDKIEKLFENNIITDNLNSDEAKSLIKIYRAIKTFSHIIDREFENIFILVDTKIDENIQITVNSDGFYFFKYNGELVQLAHCKRTHDKLLQNKYKTSEKYSKLLAENIVQIVKYFNECSITKEEMLLDPSDIFTLKPEQKS